MSGGAFQTLNPSLRNVSLLKLAETERYNLYCTSLALPVVDVIVQPLWLDFIFTSTCSKLHKPVSSPT